MGMRELPRRVRSWFRSDAEILSDIDEEIAFHLEMRASRLQREGVARRAAEEQAQREFGNAHELRAALSRRDASREQRLRVRTLLDDVRQDVRFAVRGFARRPGFTAVAIGTLMLGIGACVAMFTVVNAVLLRPLPYATADRLVQLWPGRNFNMSLADIAGGVPSLEASTGIAQWGLTLMGVGDAAKLEVQVVDAEFFDVFGVQPILGRALRAEERDPARSGVVLLSYELWQGRFGGDPSVIGRRVQLDGYGHRDREVIGVMPRGFVPPANWGGGEIAAWIPLHLPPGRELRNDSTWYVNNVIGLLRPGASVDATAREVSAALHRARNEQGLVVSDDALRTIGAMSLVESLVGDTRRALWLLLGAVGLVLLLACVNLANLMLARGESRRAELAARAALGGTRTRLVRELVTESMVLATVGAAGGVLLASLIIDVLRVAESAGLPRAREQYSIDVRVLAFTVVATALAVTIFALLPALRSTAGDLRPALGSGRRSAGSSAAGRRVGAALIACEVALAMVLVTGAALLIASFRGMRTTDAGLDARDVIAVTVAPATSEYSDASARMLYAQLLERVRALPGVAGAGAIHLLPFTANNWSFPYLAEGHTPVSGQPLPSANFRVVTPGYFDAVDVRVLRGRGITESDATDGPAVGLINHTLAEELWPGQDAVGREIKLFGSNPFRVVGVVEDVRQHTLRERPLPEIYLPLQQYGLTSMVLMVETQRPHDAVMREVQKLIRDIDPDVPVPQMRPLRDVMNDSLARERFFAQVLAFFGLLALLLGGVGVYGVMAYAMSARVPEFGVRLALGATHTRVVGESLRGGLVPVAIGLAAGTVAAVAAAGLLESLLFGVEPGDPLVLLLAGLVLGGTAFAACWLPVRRVRNVEPMSVLNAS